MSTHNINLPPVHSGKVRDIFDAGDNRLLMIASDRISAFDVVMDEPVPDKGRVLTAMSAYWFETLADVLPSHLISTDVADLPPEAQVNGVAGRAMLCHRGRHAAYRVHRAGVYQWLGLEGVQGPGHHARPGFAGRAPRV